MERKVTKAEAGIEPYVLPEEKRCPICRREVSQEDTTHIQNTYASNPNLEDSSYGWAPHILQAQVTTRAES